MHGWLTRARTRALALIAVPMLATSIIASSTAQATPLRIGNWQDAVWAELWSPQSMPPGTNDWSCHPSAAHPVPVILVHGTIANAAISWQALAPMLKNAGYCVYAFNYGATWVTGGRFYAANYIKPSAAELSTFVDKVRASTLGAPVDLVGHSQGGGLMPRYYLKSLGGASKVRTLVGLAPSNHGTTASGLALLAIHLQTLGVPLVLWAGCYSCWDQEIGSSFVRELDQGGDTVAGPRYVQIATKYDEVITPQTSQSFLTGPNVLNIKIQDQCSNDYADHVAIMYDTNALQNVLNVLGPNVPNFRATCSTVWPLFGG